MKQFELFISSPYFNQSEKLVKLFRLIEPHQPLFNSNKLEKEKIHKALHGKSKYNDQTMRELISDMFKLAKDFLVHEEAQKNNLQGSVKRYQWFFDHGLEKLADSELETRRTLLDKRLCNDRDYYHQQSLYDQHRFEVISKKFTGKEHKLIKEFDFFTHIHSLNREYVVKGLWNHIYLLALSKLYNFTLNEEMLNQFETLAKPYFKRGDVVIDILYDIFKLTKSGIESDYYELKERFFANNKTIPSIVIIEAGIALENYTVKKIREGVPRYIDEAFEIYKFEVENNYHLTNGGMSYVYYQNVAIMATQTKHFDWAEDFVETYKYILPEGYRQDSYNYAMAHVMFGRRKFKEALRLAICYQSPFLLSKMIIRILISGIHYELGMLDEMKAELETLTYYKKEKQITEERKQSLAIFIEIMEQLGELKGNFNRKKLLHLSNEIDNKNGLMHKPWFKDKIKELEVVHK